MEAKMLITVYARKEPTTDSVSIAHGQGDRLDTVIYQDRTCTQRKARFGWFQSSNPRRGQKTVTINRWRWAVEWLPDRTQ